MIALNEHLATLTLGAPVHFRALTVVPLFGNPTAVQADPGYLLLEDAVAAGLASVSELHEGASVPELQFRNAAAQPVLLLDGEELIGAKQNRTLNLTVLAPPQSTIVIPVSCVEAGRWHVQSEEFKPAPRVMFAAARADRASQVTESMRRTGTRRSDQQAVWASIEAKAARMEAPSPTHAMADVFERHAVSVENYVRAFTCLDGQAGVAFAIAGRTGGFDLFDHPATMRRLFPKLLRSYALDAMERDGDTKAPAPGAFERMMHRAASATAFTQPAVGMGKDVRFEGERIAGAALWAGDRYVHACAFRRDTSNRAGYETRMSSPRRRASL